MNKLMSAALTVSLALAGLGLSTTSPGQADQVQVPVMSQGGDRETRNLPRTGQSQQAVRQQFGEPATTRGPVGQPPITQWHYDDFVVYFEYSHVIHSVLKPSGNRGS